MTKTKRALVTGGAGFIGSHLCDRLLGDGWEVTAVDNFDPFYDQAIKRANIRAHFSNPQYELVEADIRDLDGLKRTVRGRFDAIIHLAAKAGVRPSLLDPAGYQAVNVVGTQNMLELARALEVEQFVFASSSSVYGVNPGVPWREDDHVLLPISPYASTKVSGELLGHVYSHLYGIRFIGLRFFTVYGPRQRPDLAIHKMTRLMLEGKSIPVYGDGSASRDYTFIHDIVEGIFGAIHYRGSRYEIINLGNSRTVTLMEMIHAIEKVAGVRARMDHQPDQPGDVPRTFADTSKARQLLGYAPGTEFETGLREFFDWFTAHNTAATYSHA